MDRSVSGVDKRVSSMESPARKSRSLSRRECLLAVVMVGLFLLVAVVAYWQRGWVGVMQAAIGCLACWGASAAALAVSALLTQPGTAYQAMLIAMFVRTGVPLVAALAFHLHGGLDNRPAIYYLVVFYCAALGTEIPLSLADLQGRRPLRSDAQERSDRLPDQRTS